MTEGLNDGRGKFTGSTHNVVEFEENTRSRRFRASVSDRAIESISDPLALFLANQTGEQFKRRRRPSAGGIDNSQSSLPGFTKEADIIDTETKTDSENPSEGLLLPERGEAGQLRQIFHSNADGQLRLVNPRLKQNSRSDFVLRLSVLFLYACATAGEEMVPRKKLNKILNDARVYDGNARTWIAHADLLSHDEDTIGLSIPGRERAKEVLREVADPNIDTKWTLGSRQSGHKGKTNTKGGKNSEQKEKKGAQGKRQQGTSYYAQISKLIAEDFFTQEHSGEEVQAKLKQLGYTFPLGQINGVLVKQTKNGKLSRRKDESDKWAYQNNK